MFDVKKRHILSLLLRSLPSFFLFFCDLQACSPEAFTNIRQQKHSVCRSEINFTDTDSTDDQF